MIREDTFTLSHRPYAADMTSLSVTDPRESGYVSCRIGAVWFRRRSVGYGTGKRLVTVACVGELRDSQRPAPADAEAFLKAHDDGRYGGRCQGRWDGEHYWGSQLPEEIEAHLALLRPMLADYPACPAGWDGWWAFR